MQRSYRSLPAAAAAVVHPPGTPEELICHVEKQIELRDDTKLHLDMVAGEKCDMLYLLLSI